MTKAMLRKNAAEELFSRARLVPVLAYAGLVVSFSMITWLALASLASDYAQYAAAADVLARLEGRKPSPRSFGPGSALQGSPFLEGPTVTVAGAALQQRVVEAVRKAGGNVVSTQIDFQEREGKQGFVGLSATGEIGQSGLQQLLYDLETGMPFLFIDQLVVQLPQAERGMGAGTEAARLRVQIDVSGQWQATQ